MAKIFAGIVIGILCVLPAHAVSVSSAPAVSAPAPLVISVIVPPGLRTEVIDKTDRSFAPSSPDWALVISTAVLAAITFGLALYTARLFRATVKLGQEAKNTGNAQANRMEQSIVEARRAATAMERLATAMQTNTELMPALLRKQMRAYLTVDTGGARYQDANTIFEALPTITNNGLTPARNVSYKISSGLIDARQGDIVFPDTGVQKSNDVSVSPRSQYSTNAMLDHRVPDGEVDAIMEGNVNRLFTWGQVTYDDVYGEQWETNFCINYRFVKIKDPDGKVKDVRVLGYYYPKHNNAT
jgi:hypothetical protein